MKAAVVTDFDQPPTYQEFADPIARAAGEAVVEVLAAALHPRVRSGASGSHYTSTGELPLIPGVDGVVRDQNGQVRYAILEATTLGTMAERTIIELRRSVPLPDEVDPVLVAAAMNPAMASWVALRRRIDFESGWRVAILGATGNAGRMAIQVAKLLGASHVIAAGRDNGKLAELSELGADLTCTLDELHIAHDVDVVIDYLWGQPAETGMVDIVTHRSDRSRPLTWIQIGSVAGATAAIPSAALRSSRLQIVGSGIGSVPGRDWIEELPQLVEAVTNGSLEVRAKAVPLRDVREAWTSTADSGHRIVFVP